MPPSKVGVIESGNLGGGTGTSQDKTFRVNTCGPVGEAVIEKLVFHLARQAFKVPPEWTLRFGDIDWRDDKVVDEISAARLKDGRWTLNRARAEIGEPPVDGGDDSVIVLSRDVVRWVDVEKYSTAAASKSAADAVPIPSSEKPIPPSEKPIPPSEAWITNFREQLLQVREELDG